MFLPIKKNCSFVLSLFLAAGIICVKPILSHATPPPGSVGQDKDSMAERNPDWDNRLGEGDLMEVTEKWLNKQKKTPSCS
jgi:hypothetical protein